MVIVLKCIKWLIYPGYTVKQSWLQNRCKMYTRTLMLCADNCNIYSHTVVFLSFPVTFTWQYVIYPIHIRILRDHSANSFLWWPRWDIVMVLSMWWKQMSCHGNVMPYEQYKPVRLPDMWYVHFIYLVLLCCWNEIIIYYNNYNLQLLHNISRPWHY